MASSEKTVVDFIVQCSDLPPANWGGHAEIWLGIQSGNDVVQAVKLPGDKISFQGQLKLGNSEGESSPNFLGPFAHGKVQERFLYLCWGSWYGGNWVGFRRAKLPLQSISWQDVGTGLLVAELRCTDSKGGPICATVKSEFLTWSGKSA